MKFEPSRYKRFERTPIGCFEAHMTANGWAETKYVNDTSSVLLYTELTEFIRLVEFIFKECPDWQKLERYAKKHGTELRDDDYNTKYVMNFLCDTMDYTVHISNTLLNIFPYRKAQHINIKDEHNYKKRRGA